MMKRCLFTVVLLAALFASNICYAANTGISGLFSYTIKGNGTIEITGFDWDNNHEDIYIPPAINGYTVTSIGDEAFACSKEVRYSNFMQDKDYNVYLPDTITSIGEKAFFSSPISTINIPEKVTSIGDGAFAKCYLQKSFNVAPNNPTFTTINGNLYNKKTKTLVTVASGLLQNNKVYTLEIPEGIVGIGNYALYCTRATIDFSAPKSLKTIGDYAFYDNAIRKFSTSEAELEYIGEQAFANSHRQKGGRFEIPNVASVGKEAFKQFNKTAYSYPLNTYINAPEVSEGMLCEAKGVYSGTGSKSMNYVTSCAANGLNGANIYYLNIDNCTFIGQKAFANAKVDVPYYSGEYNFHYTIISPQIGKRAFENFGFIRETQQWSVTITSACKRIEQLGFSSCKTLTSVEIEDGLQYIGKQAFAKCGKLTSITVPNSVSFIGDDAIDRSTVMYVEPGSYAESWAKENGRTYKYNTVDDLSWLN